MQPLRIALAQVAPRLGELEANLERHRELIRRARGDGAGLVVFPELGLTGYLLQDLAGEVAMRLDDPRLAALAAETADGGSAVVSFVEESGDHRAVHRRGAHGGRRDPARPPEGLPARRTASSTSGGSSRPATPCERRLPGSGWASGSRCARTSGISRRRSCSPSMGRSSWSTCRRRRGETWRPGTRSGSARRHRGGRSCGPTRSSRPRSSSS